jgi:hypothetical protein
MMVRCNIQAGACDEHISGRAAAMLLMAQYLQSVMHADA